MSEKHDAIKAAADLVLQFDRERMDPMVERTPEWWARREAAEAALFEALQRKP